MPRVRRHHLIALAALVLATMSLTGTTPAQAAVRAAADPAPIYVAACTPGLDGDGSQANPFCTFAKAEAAVQPGQTVYIEPGNYAQALTITTSGTAGAPITFAGDPDAIANSRAVVNSADAIKDQPILSISGAHDVVVRNLVLYGWSHGNVTNGPVSDAVQIASSSDVTLDQDVVEIGYGLSAVHVSGTSNDVTLSRLSTISGTAVGAPTAPAIEADAGTTGLVVTENDIETRAGAVGGIAANGVPGAEITGNTLLSNCGSGITLGAGSTSATVENNIVEPAVWSGTSTTAACPAPVTASAISVAAGATSGTVVDDNLTDPKAGLTPYSWAGTTYSSVDAFRTASGQGAHDLVADPQLQQEVGGGARYYALTATSPALDSGDAAAPGELATDRFGNGRADDPAVANTGTGIGYVDRGAVEDLGPVQLVSAPTLTHVTGASPLEAQAAGQLTTPWTHTGPIGTTDFHFADSPSAITNQSGTATHDFARAGLDCLNFVATTDGFGTLLANQEVCQALGADYTPIAPARILNTRSKIGVSTTTPIAAGGTVSVPLPSVNSVPAAQISAVVVNVTDTSPTVAGGVTVYGTGTSDPGVAVVNFPAGQTRSDLVTVPMTTGLTVHNTSKGTVHVILDVEGYYSATGSGYRPLTPARVLHTTTGLGAGGVKAPLAAGGSLTVPLPSTVPTTATAAALTVTTTSATATGGLTLYPPGQTRPVPSDVVFPAGATVTSQVLARVSGGKVTFYNSSAGTVDVAADLDGFYGPASSGATGAYVPFGPKREFDSGTTKVAAKATSTVTLATLTGCSPTCATPTSYSATLSAVSTGASGQLVAYPSGTTRPVIPTVSFASGQTLSDHTTTSAGAKQSVYLDSTGTARIVADEEGYYIPAA